MFHTGIVGIERENVLVHILLEVVSFHGNGEQEVSPRSKVCLDV